MSSHYFDNCNSCGKCMDMRDETYFYKVLKYDSPKTIEICAKCNKQLQVTSISLFETKKSLTLADVTRMKTDG